MVTSVDSGLTSLPCVISMTQPALDLLLPSLGRPPRLCLLLTVTLPSPSPPRPPSVLECLRSGIPLQTPALVNTVSSFSSAIWTTHCTVNNTETGQHVT